MRMTFIVSAIIAISSTVFATSAFADKLCLKTTVDKRTFKVTTQSALAASCPTGYKAIADTSFFAGATGPRGATGPQGATGPRGATGAQISVYDVNDTLVGQIASHGCRHFFPSGYIAPFELATLLLTVGSNIYPVCAYQDGFIGTTDLAFSSNGCTGQAYFYAYAVPLSSATLLSSGHVAGAPNQRFLYRPYYITGFQTVTMRSSFNAEGSCTTNLNQTETLIPAISVLNLTTTYTAPFKAQ